MSGHALEFTGHPADPWRLVCTHGPEAFRSTLEDGADDGTGECWIRSWWDECGVDMIADDPMNPWPKPVAPFRLPVDIDGNGWEDEPTFIVPATKATR